MKKGCSKKILPATKPDGGKAHLVTQHNLLVRAKYSFTLREIKVSRLITSKVNPLEDYIPGTSLEVKITPEEARAIFAAPGKAYNSTWRDFEETVSGLKTKPICIQVNETESVIHWTSSCVRNEKTGNYQVRLTEEILPFIVGLKTGNFTSIPLDSTRMFRSKYLFRLFEILNSYRRMRAGIVRYASWKELAQQIGWAKTNYGHFKDRVLLKAQEVFKNVAPLSFTYAEKRRAKSKRVEGLVLTVATKNNTALPETKSGSIPVNAKTLEKIRSRLEFWSVSEGMIKKLLADPFEFIGDEQQRKSVKANYPNKYNYLWQKIQYVAKCSNVQDEARYLMKAIRENYVTAKQKRETRSAEKQSFRQRQSNEIATLEAQLGKVKNRAILVRSEMVIQLLNQDPQLRESVFSAAAQKLNCKVNVEELETLFHQKGIFRHEVLNRVQQLYPEQFSRVLEIEEKQILEITKKVKMIRRQPFLVFENQ